MQWLHLNNSNSNKDCLASSTWFHRFSQLSKSLPLLIRSSFLTFSQKSPLVENLSPLFFFFCKPLPIPLLLVQRCLSPNHHHGKVVMSLPHIPCTPLWKSSPTPFHRDAQLSQGGKKISHEMPTMKAIIKKNEYPLVRKRGLPICPFSVEFMRIRNMNTRVKRKYE